jgi:hypothetical protein
MYVCMYVCMYVRTYVRTYVRKYVCMYVRTYVCMYICVYVCMYVCIYENIYVCMFMHVCMCVCMYVCIHTYSYIFWPFLRIFMWSMDKNMLKYVGVNESAFIMNYIYIYIVPVILLTFIILCEHILVSKVYWPMAYPSLYLFNC